MDSISFDEWAFEYDDSVKKDIESGKFPFKDYMKLMEREYKNVRGNRILELGIGSGSLSAMFLGSGYEIMGVDFSENMLSLCREKMPEAVLVSKDLSHGIDSELSSLISEFNPDTVVANYFMHHFDNHTQAKILNDLNEILNPDAKILIGDVAFRDTESREAAKEKNADLWDDQENYPVLTELLPLMNTKQIGFINVGEYTGILEIRVE